MSASASCNNRQTERVQAQAEISQGIKNRVVTNSLVSIVAKIIYLLSRLAVPPIILSYISLEEYGVWTYCFIAIGYVGMSVMGFSTVFILAGADYIASRDLAKLNGMVATGFWLSCGAGLVLLVLCWLSTPWLVSSLKLPPALADKAYWLIFGSEVSFLLCVTIGSLGSLIIGLQKIVAEQTIWVISFLLETVAMILFFRWGFGVFSLLYAFLARYVFVVTTSVFFSYRWVPGLSLRWRYVNTPDARHFFGFGSILQLSGFLSMMLRSAEKILAGWLLNVKVVGIMDLGEKFPMMAMSLPSAINGTIIPAAAALHAGNDRVAIQDLFLMATRHVNLFASLLSAYFLAFAMPLVSAWLGNNESLVSAVFVMMIFSLPYHLDVLTGPTSSILRGCSVPKYELMYPVSQFLLIALLLIPARLLLPDSLEMICWVVASAMSLSAMLFTAFGAYYLKVSQKRLLQRAILPGVLPYAIAMMTSAGVQAWLPQASRLDSIILCAVGGLLYGIVSLAALYFLIADEGEKAFVSTRLARVRQFIFARGQA